MKLMAGTLVSLFAVVALANQPAAAPAAKTETKSTTTTTETKTADAKADMKKGCEGKMGEELKKCEAEAKKTHK